MCLVPEQFRSEKVPRCFTDVLISADPRASREVQSVLSSRSSAQPVQVTRTAQYVLACRVAHKPSNCTPPCSARTCSGGVHRRELSLGKGPMMR